MLRKAFRYRLRGLLILLTIVACFAGWYSKAKQSRTRELAVIRELDELNPGYILQLYDDDTGPWCGTGLGGVARFKWCGPPGQLGEYLRKKEICIFYRLKELTLYGDVFVYDGKLNDQIIKHLVRLRSLDSLSLKGHALSLVGIDTLKSKLVGVAVELEESYSNSETNAEIVDDPQDSAEHPFADFGIAVPNGEKEANAFLA